MSTPSKTPPLKSRANVRFDADIWDKIDQARLMRAGFVSRNSWILEAIIEKLENEEASSKTQKAANDA